MVRLPGIIWHLITLAVLGSYLSTLLRNLRAIRRLEDEPPPSSPHSRISVLIPARNESDNLPRCLDSLLAQDYPRFDVKVLDDRSEDDTRDVVARYASIDRRVSLVDGSPLPDGWIGKPWACRQLASDAGGDTLLFLDADTWLEPDTLGRTAGLMERERPDLLSLLAHQETETIAERIVIPGLYMAFLCNIPLWKLEDPERPDVAVANGQFLCFDRETYHAVGGHESVRSEIIEDLAFARVIKRAGYRLAVRSAVETVHCRMYRSWREVLDGFSKNAYGATGETPGAAALFIGLLAGTQVFPSGVAIVSMLTSRRSMMWCWLPAAEATLLVLTRYLMSDAMRFRRRDALYAPLTAVAAVGIMVRSIWWKYRSGYAWKGRRL